MQRLRLVLLAIALGASAFAQETTTPVTPTATPAPAEAKDLRTSGQVHLRMGRYEEALAALLAAYEAEPDPEMLLPIARCYAELRNWEKAAFFSGEYLRVPDATAREAAEALLAEAKTEIERDREMERLTRLLGNPGVPADSLGPAAGTTGATVALASAPPEATGRDTAVLAPAPPHTIAAPVVVATPSRSKPMYRRWWFLCGASALAIAAAGGAAAASSRPAERKTLPEGDLGTIDRRNP